MKHIHIFILVLIFLISCKQKENTANTEKNTAAVFSGTIKNTDEPEIKVVDYNHSYEKDIPIDKNGTFKDTIKVKRPGTYFFQVGKSYYTFMLKNNYNLNVSLDAADFYNTIQFSGEGSKINNFNVSRKKLKSELIGNSKDFFLVPLDTFLQKTENNKSAFLELLEKSDLNPEEKEIQKKIIEYDFLSTRNNYDKFVYFHTKKHPDLPENYYDPVKKMDIDDEDAFCYSKSYRNLLFDNLNYTFLDARKKNPDLSFIEFTKNKIKNIKSSLIKDRFVSLLFRTINAKNKNIDQDYKEILSLLTSERLKKKLTNRYNTIKSTKPKMETIGFDYINFKGGKTKLKDLEGNIVYIDVWATWCGPCKKEIPFMEKLIEEYKGEKIAFVSISADSKKDYDKWRKMVSDKKLKGIQLFADNSFKSEFMKFYNVSLIPRYLLIDEKGVIISAQAPRPSSKEIRKVLDSLLTRFKK